MFYIDFYSPTLQKNLKVKELTFKQYRDLNKFIINNNNFFIADYFDTIIKDCLYDKEYFDHLTNFDKFCLLFLLRCLFVSPDIEYKNGPNAVKQQLIPFLKKYFNFKTEFSEELNNDPLKVIISLPKILFFDNIYDALYSSVDRIYIDNNEIEFLNNPEEKLKIIENLPAEILTGLKSFSDRITKDFSSLTLEVGIDKKNKVELNPYNTSLFEILKAMFTANLKNIYEVQYLLVSKLRYSADYIDKNTLAENLVLCNLYETEMAKLKEEQDKIMDKKGPQPK